MSEPREVYSSSFLECVMFGPPPFLMKQRPFSLPDMNGGLPCPTCCVTQYTSMQYPTWGAGYENGKRIEYLCPHCDAMICGRCCANIMPNPKLHNAQCKWCCNKVYPIKRITLSEEEQQLPSFQCYFQTDANIRDTLRNWQYAMLNRYGFTYDRSQIYWKDIVRSMGWRFFVDFDFRLTVQHPTQFGILMSMMIRKSFSRFRRFQQVLPPFDRQFTELPNHMQFLYEQSRKCAIMHNLSVFFTNKLTDGHLTRQYSLIIQRRVLANLAEKMSLGMGICEIVDVPREDIGNDNVPSLNW